MADADGDVHVASLDEIKSLWRARISAPHRERSGFAAADRPDAGLPIAEVRPGFALFTMTPAFKHYNPIGTVHGGVASTLLDSCMSCAIQTHLEKGFGYTTLELKVNLVRPITEKTGPIRAEGRSLYVGRRSGTAEGKIIDASGTLLAHGTTTCMIFAL